MEQFGVVGAGKMRKMTGWTLERIENKVERLGGKWEKLK